MKSKKKLIILFIIFLIGNINILFNINDFIYLGSSQFSDIPITHYSNLLFIQKSIQENQQIPLWSNLIFSGYPFAANPLSGLWYFPGWLALLFPLPAGINITLLLHLLIGLFGMYFFLQSLNISENGSLLGSIAFVFSAKIYAHIGAGHLSLIYAISWTPWLLFLTNKYKSGGTPLNYNMLSGLFWGLILLADLRWSIPAFLIWSVLILEKKNNFLNQMKFIAISLGIGLLLSMTTWLPLIQFLSLSNRSGLSPNEQMIFSMSIVDFLNFSFPFFEGNAETRVYPGAVVVLLSILGVFLHKHNQHIRKWYVLALISLIFSFGENIPGMNLIYEIPGFSLTRVPARFLFPLLFALSIISAMVFDAISKSLNNYSFNRVFFLSPVVIFVILFSFGSFLLTKELTINFVWSIIVFSSGFLLIFLLQKNTHNPLFLAAILLVVLVIDLIFVNYSSLRFASSVEVNNNAPELMRKLTEISPNFRVYTPSYSVSQEQGAYWSIHQVNGVDPLQLQQYVNFFEQVSGISIDNYSVTLPPFGTGNPELDNYGICPDREKLQELNTIYVVSAFELLNCNLGTFEFISNQYVYEIGEEDNYLRFQDCPKSKNQYSIIKYSPNEIVLDIESCGGILQISEINYPGWKIFIDEQQVALNSKSLFRSVSVPEGQHELRMVFKPNIIFAGLVVQSLTWLFSVLYILFVHLKK
ncbi:MAG: hypothetical protein K0B14_04140 [Anaerolineaceae bacterium]|nr:hypothetical protein [Anaerolineaceae bacterium]